MPSVGPRSGHGARRLTVPGPHLMLLEPSVDLVAERLATWVRAV